MELENMDKAYTRSKKALDKSGKFMTTVETLKKEVKTLKRQIENIDIAIIRAREDGDTAQIKTLEQLRKAPKAELEKKRQQLIKLNTVIHQNKAIIDEKMAELSSDPELKAHLDEVIGKKFSRKLAKIEKEKEDKTKQNEVLTRIQEAAKKDPNVMFLLKAIGDGTRLVSEAQAIIADPTKTPAEIATVQRTLPILQNALEKNRSDLARYFKGTISREVIDKITSYEDLGREIKSNTRYVKGLDKQIANYKTALENIGYVLPSSSTTRTSTRGTTSSRPTLGQPTPSTDLPAEQPKWWQFRKRFQNWNARRKSKTAQPTPISAQDKKKFKDSMKYEMVRDYEEKLAADLLKQAKAQNKNAADRERDDN